MSPEERWATCVGRRSSALMWCFGELQLSLLGAGKGLADSAYPGSQDPTPHPAETLGSQSFQNNILCSSLSASPTIPETPQAPFVE